MQIAGDMVAACTVIGTVRHNLACAVDVANVDKEV